MEGSGVTDDDLWRRVEYGERDCVDRDHLHEHERLVSPVWSLDH